MRGSTDLHNYLQNLGIKHEIFLVKNPPLRTQRAASLLGLPLEEIVKCVLLMADDEMVLACVRASEQVSLEKLKSLLKCEEIRLAAVDEVTKKTEYMLGATPPCGFACSIKTFIDKRILEKDVVYTGGGEITAVLKIRSKDLVKAAKAKVADIANA